MSKEKKSGGTGKVIKPGVPSGKTGKFQIIIPSNKGTTESDKGTKTGSTGSKRKNTGSTGPRKTK